MKPIFKWTVFFLVFFLSACQENTVVLPTHEVSIGTFEHFYAVGTRYNPIESQLEVSLTQKTNDTFEDMSVTIRLYFEYIYDFEQIKDYSDFEFDLSESLRMTKPLTHGDNFKVLGYAIMDADGTVTLSEDVTISTKNYQFLYEKENKEVVDQQTNLSILESLQSNIMSYDEHIKTGYQVVQTLTQSITYNGQTDTTSLTTRQSYQKSPFYVSVSNPYYEVFMMSDPYRVYSWDGTLYRGTKLLQETRFTDQESMVLDEVLNNYIQDYNLNKWLKYSQNEAIYEVKGTIGDFLPEQELKELEALFAQLGSEFDFILKVPFFITYDFTDDLIITVEYLINVEEISIDTKIVTTYNTDQISIIDVESHPGYTVSVPDTMDEVTTETDFSKTINQDDPYLKHVYFGYLEAGIYDFYLSQDIQFYFYGEDQRMVWIEKPNASLSSDLIEIETSGYYYLILDRTQAGHQGTYTASLTKTDLQDLFSNAVDLNENPNPSVLIESDQDIVKLTYDSPYNLALIKFTSDLDENVKVYSDWYRGEFIMDFFITDQVFPLKKGINTFYFKDEATFNLQTEVIILPNYYTLNLSSMTAVSNIYFEEDFYYGGTLGAAYFKVIIPETASYSFYIEGIYATINQLNGNVLSSIGTIYGTEDIILEPGTYVIAFNGGFIQQGNIYFEKTPVEDFYSYVTFNEIDPNEIKPFYTLASQFTSRLSFTDQVHVYEFTLEAQSSVFISGQGINIMDESGFDYSLSPGTFYPTNTILTLDAGTYKVIQNTYDDSPRYFDLYLGLLPVLEDDQLDFYDDIEIGIPVVKTKDHRYDSDLIRFTVDVAGTYQISGIVHYELFDENHQSLRTNNYEFDLEPGTYIIHYQAILDQPVTILIESVIS